VLDPSPARCPLAASLLPQLPGRGRRVSGHYRPPLQICHYTWNGKGGHSLAEAPGEVMLSLIWAGIIPFPLRRCRTISAIWAKRWRSRAGTFLFCFFFTLKLVSFLPFTRCFKRNAFCSCQGPVYSQSQVPTGISPLVHSLGSAGGSFCPPARVTPPADPQAPWHPFLVTLTNGHGQMGGHEDPGEHQDRSNGHDHHQHEMLRPQPGAAWGGGQRGEGVSHRPWGPGSRGVEQNGLLRSFFISSPNFGLMMSVEQETRGRKRFS